MQEGMEIYYWSHDFPKGVARVFLVGPPDEKAVAAVVIALNESPRCLVFAFDDQDSPLTSTRGGDGDDGGGEMHVLADALTVGLVASSSCAGADAFPVVGREGVAYLTFGHEVQRVVSAHLGPVAGSVA